MLAGAPEIRRGRGAVQWQLGETRRKGAGVWELTHDCPSGLAAVCSARPVRDYFAVVYQTMPANASSGSSDPFTGVFPLFQRLKDFDGRRIFSCGGASGGDGQEHPCRKGEING